MTYGKPAITTIKISGSDLNLFNELRQSDSPFWEVADSKLGRWLKNTPKGVLEDFEQALTRYELDDVVRRERENGIIHQYRRFCEFYRRGHTPWEVGGRIRFETID